MPNRERDTTGEIGEKFSWKTKELEKSSERMEDPVTRMIRKLEQARKEYPDDGVIGVIGGRFAKARKHVEFGKKLREGDWQKDIEIGIGFEIAERLEKSLDERIENLTKEKEEMKK